MYFSALGLPDEDGTSGWRVEAAAPLLLALRVRWAMDWGRGTRPAVGCCFEVPESARGTYAVSPDMAGDFYPLTKSSNSTRKWNQPMKNERKRQLAVHQLKRVT